jgi:hypothetical protein
MPKKRYGRTERRTDATIIPVWTQLIVRERTIWFQFNYMVFTGIIFLIYLQKQFYVSYIIHIYIFCTNVFSL